MKKFQPKGNYEAKIQIRPKSQELLDFVLSELKKANVRITDEHTLKEGFDLYIDSAEFGVRLGKLFRNKYKIKPIVPSSLIGEDKQLGKRINRLTVCLKLS